MDSEKSTNKANPRLEYSKVEQQEQMNIIVNEKIIS